MSEFAPRFKQPTPPEAKAEDKVPESINYGTHTLPKKFWTSVKEGENLLNTKAFRERLAAKHSRHEQNKANKAEQNRGKRR